MADKENVRDAETASLPWRTTRPRRGTKAAGCAGQGLSFRLKSSTVKVVLQGAILSAAMLVAGVNSAMGATIYLVGYTSVFFNGGSNLISNPLQVYPSNFLNDVFTESNNTPIPVGTTVSLWNPTNLSFQLASVFTNDSWSSNIMLPPGTGALLVAPAPFTNLVTGYVLNHDGTPVTNGFLGFIPPPVFTNTNGLYPLADKSPLTDVGTNIYVNILGRPPFPGEQVISLTATNTYLGNGTWDTLPVLSPGQSVFLNIMSVAPPVLSIVQINGNVIVSWPPAYTNWTLQTNGDLVNGNWVNYTGPIVNTSVTNLPVFGQLYYRLFF